MNALLARIDFLDSQGKDENRKASEMDATPDEIVFAGYTASQLRNLTVLDLSHEQIGDERMRQFSAASANLRNLTKLVLTSNRIRDEGMRHFAAASVNLPNLSELDLSYNQIDDEGMRHFASASVNLRNLTTLYLSGNVIGDDGMRHFAAASVNLRNLTFLYLYGTQIGDEGMRHFAAASANLRNLTELVLTGTQIGDEGMRQFAAASVNLPNLTVLKLSVNRISDEGMRHFAEASVNLRNLTTLYLSANRIGFNVMLELEDADWLGEMWKLSEIRIRFSNYDNQIMERNEALFEATKAFFFALRKLKATTRRIDIAVGGRPALIEIATQTTLQSLPREQLEILKKPRTRAQFDVQTNNIFFAFDNIVNRIRAADPKNQTKVRDALDYYRFGDPEALGLNNLSLK